ncbi:aromatic-ring-hydroxylating dioxygenase subunit beta [Paraburkholderia aspalathi]|uniref:aromatic-ring-hydroxylating dioxygenase subunit beta n=1 Tax=Paraburkholderia aspalathi TaxID=1324617 RepID=UPI001B0CA40E|nr:aromatic-ring-hydroxylating dioxygenase subunit beta [Paraburkholderia aspalathi]CAE6840691.1 p-cumate 2,3-dioxygenase system, small oxygenase component [Paraburkholderia aspalathi]
MSVLGKVSQFLAQEARLLDEGKFEEWATLFTEDGYYWMPASTDRSNPYSEISIFFDDRLLMQERIARLRHPRVHAQLPPSRTSRLVANISLETPRKGEEQLDGDVLVRSKLLMGEFRPNVVPDEGNRRFFTGTCWHLLRPSAESYKMRWKRVDIIDADAALAPISVYF